MLKLHTKSQLSGNCVHINKFSPIKALVYYPQNLFPTHNPQISVAITILANLFNSFVCQPFPLRLGVAVVFRNMQGSDLAIGVHTIRAVRVLQKNYRPFARDCLRKGCFRVFMQSKISISRPGRSCSCRHGSLGEVQEWELCRLTQVLPSDIISVMGANFFQSNVFNFVKNEWTKL